MSGLVFHLIAHTHWDREWYLPRAAFHARLVPMLDDLVARLTADPAYRTFLLDGQTILLEDYVGARPEREADVKALVKTVRLQVGPWYVLADEQIPSGESLVRNLLCGAADAERWGGRCDAMYSPDAFGHPAAWPSLAREFGIRSGALWRGLGGEPGQERDLYHWRGRDGQEVVVWHLPPAGYEIGAALPADPARLAEAWRPVRAALVDRAATKHVPVFVGADHHTAHPDLPRLRDLLAALEPDSAVRISRLDEALSLVAAEGGAGKAAPLEGELRWSYRYAWTLQGVHGTRAPQKRRHARAELWLERHAEPLAALARRHGGGDRRALLETAWRTLLACQFHDAIAGCSSDVVAAEVDTRLAAVEGYAQEIARGALHELAGYDPDAVRERPEPGEPALVLWNPAARPRGGIVTTDVTFFRRDMPVGPSGGNAPPPRNRAGAFALAGLDGQGTTVQVMDRRPMLERRDAVRHYPDVDEVEAVRVAFRAPIIPALGCAALSVVGPVRRADAERVRARGRSLANRFVEVTLEPSGALGLRDRASGERFSGLLRLEDTGDAGDTYSYCPPARDRRRRSAGPIAVRRLAAGPLVAALEARWTQARAYGARLVVMLYADSPVVRCILHVDNQATDHRLRARVPTGLTDVVAVAGAAFGAERRPPVTADPADFPLETPVRTAPAHRFVAAAQGKRGLAILAPGFFEYEWTPSGDLVVTLLRAVGQLSRGDLPTRPGHAGWPTPTPGAQCLGPDRVELGLVPVTAEDVDRGDSVPALWEDTFLPIWGVWLRDAGPLAVSGGEIALEGPGLVLSAVKPAQNGSGTVLRCYNATGAPAPGAWHFGDGVKTAHRVRADERESQALVLEQRGRTLRFVAKPHEIVTIQVT
jgi:mannosylglycerate hydrolase